MKLVALSCSMNDLRDGDEQWTVVFLDMAIGGKRLSVYTADYIEPGTNWKIVPEGGET